MLQKTIVISQLRSLCIFSLHTVHPLKNCKMLRNSLYPSQPAFSFGQPLNSVPMKPTYNSAKRTTINSQNDTKNNRKEANDVGRTELARDEQTDSDSRPIGFRGIASREEGTKRQREKKGGWVGGRHPGSRAFDRGWRVVAWRKSDLSGNLSRDTKFKSQSAFRASRTRGRKRERERERERNVVAVCPRAVGDSKSGSGITGEGESEIRPSNRISRGQTLSVTKPLRYWVTDGRLTSPTEARRNPLMFSLWHAKFRATVQFFRSELVGGWLDRGDKRRQLFKSFGSLTNR